MLFIVLVMMGALLPLITWVERKQAAIMQDRIGANRADIFGIRALGLLHPAADVLKLLTKEDVVPRGANRVLHLLAPVIALVPAIVDARRDPVRRRLPVRRHDAQPRRRRHRLGHALRPRGGSLAVYGVVIAGWASNNNWSLLGGMRASAQMISYEIAMGLALVGVFMAFGTLRLTGDGRSRRTRRSGCSASSRPLRRLVRAPGLARLDPLRPGGSSSSRSASSSSSPASAENKRPPFDPPEGESEIIAGYFTEYSGMRFGLFYTAEFVEVPVIARARRDALLRRLGGALALAGDDHLAASPPPSAWASRPASA